MAKSTKKKVATKKTAKKVEKKKVEKSEKTSGSRKKYGEFTSNELRTMEVLGEGGDFSRNDLKKATGIEKGWSGMLGSPTRTIKHNTLEGRGFVKHQKHEAQGEGEGKTPAGFFYTITGTGKKALAVALKAKEAAEVEEE